MHAAEPDDAALVAAARRFELPALLRVLRHRGYAAEDIWFEGVRDAPRAPGLVDALRLEPSPRRAIVRLAAGMLGVDGPLPSYFRRLVDELGDPRPLLAFMRFFDHVALANHAYVAHPADGVAHGSPLARAYQVIAGVRSPARLHAVLRQIVPELALEVIAAPLVRRETHPPAQLGAARLDGGAIVGSAHTRAAPGLVARFHAETMFDDRGARWADVVRARCLRTLPPLVRRARQGVEIRLAVASYTGRSRLARPAQLGVEPVTRGEAQAWEVSVVQIVGGA